MQMLHFSEMQLKIWYVVVKEKKLQLFYSSNEGFDLQNN